MSIETKCPHGALDASAPPPPPPPPHFQCHISILRNSHVLCHLFCNCHAYSKDGPCRMSNLNKYPWQAPQCRLWILRNGNVPCHYFFGQGPYPVSCRLHLFSCHLILEALCRMSMLRNGHVAMSNWGSRAPLCHTRDNSRQPNASTWTSRRGWTTTHHFSLSPGSSPWQQTSVTFTTQRYEWLCRQPDITAARLSWITTSKCSFLYCLLIKLISLVVTCFLYRSLCPHCYIYAQELLFFYFYKVDFPGLS